MDRAKKTPPNLWRLLTNEQDDALEAVMEKVSSERGNRVTRPDVVREALAAYCRARGVEWPC